MPPTSSDTSAILLTCAREIPLYLAQELTALGHTITAMHPAGVEIQGTLADCVQLNNDVRTAHRVLYRLGEWEVRDPGDMYDAVYSVPWEEWIHADGYVSVVGSVKTPSIDNSQYANMLCKDAIVDRIREKKGRRPDAGSATDGSVVFLYWHKDVCMVYADTSGHALSDRGYRIHPAKAPMRESLAAAVVMAMNWNRNEPFVNPMCGSGTLGIEAAMIACDIAPGSLRRDYAYQHLLPCEHMRPTPRARKHVDTEFILTDHDPRVVRFARENAREAGVDKMLRFDVCDFRKTPMPRSSGGVVVMNPEYGMRLGDTRQLEDTYAEIGDFFKQDCKGRTGYVFSGNLTLLKYVGLRSSKRLPFWTADLESRLIEYELYDGTRKIKTPLEENAS